MHNTIKSINPLITGVFLLIWSMNAYFIFGPVGRFAALVGGFLLIVTGAIYAPNKKGSDVFFWKTLVFYLVYLLIAEVREQETLGATNLVFGLICLGLINAGFILGKNLNRFNKLPLVLAYLFVGLTIAGSILFIRYQAVTGMVSRSFDFEDSVNAIGIAYTHGILMLFFVAIYKTQKEPSLLFKGTILLTLIVLFAVVLSTQSRGAILFLAAIFLLVIIKSTKVRKRFWALSIRIVLIGAVVLLGLIAVQKEFPIIETRIEGTLSRFQNLLNYASDQEGDASADARSEYYESIFDNFESIVWVGQKNYTPYPHNQFLEIIARWGLFGLPLLFFSIVSIAKAVKITNYQLYSMSPVVMLVVTIFLFSYLQSMTSLSLEMNRMLWFGFGFIVGSYQPVVLLTGIKKYFIRNRVNTNNIY